MPSLSDPRLQAVIEHAVLQAVRKVQEADIPDLDCMEVRDIVQWAERKMQAPGTLRGERRRACGIELIRRGVEVLCGRMPLPKDRPHRLKVYAAGEGPEAV